MKIELEFSFRYADRACDAMRDFSRMTDGLFGLCQTSTTTWEYEYDEYDYEYDEEYKEKVEQFKEDLNWHLHGLCEIPVDEWSETLY